MYKIFVKYTSTSKKTFWYEHKITQGDGTSIPFSTSDLATLKAEVKKLDQVIGFESIRIVDDITYNIMVDVVEESDACDHEIATSEDIENIYNTAYTKVFGGG